MVREEGERNAALALPWRWKPGNPLNKQRVHSLETWCVVYWHGDTACGHSLGGLGDTDVLRDAVDTTSLACSWCGGGC